MQGANDLCSIMSTITGMAVSL